MTRIVDDVDFNSSFLQQDLEAAYRDELRWRRVITWAAGGAVLISALGAFALTALAAGRRTKEIGIRKALGATVVGLTAPMAREFAWLGLLGAAVACPLAGWWMRDWLDGFAIRIDLAPWALRRRGRDRLDGGPGQAWLACVNKTAILF